MAFICVCYTHSFNKHILNVYYVNCVNYVLSIFHFISFPSSLYLNLFSFCPLFLPNISVFALVIIHKVVVAKNMNFHVEIEMN